ncbi:putative palmitoyltransferase ZDHHC13 [Trichomycterus rosablanca]|uniref:putative palmitoyltransferase ZDHHC13 n=1 Tax=Trichomycterus rosablanca TaxID=2290929 RepID=UPI002F3600B2
MDWAEGNGSHSHNQHNAGHSHGGHGQCHGHGHGGHGGHAPGFMPGFQFMQKGEGMLDPSQLPKKFAPVEDSSSWDIVKAAQFGAFDRCRELVEAGYDVRLPDKENVTLLHWAAINNRLDLIKYFISKGAIVDQLGGDLNSTPLHWAIRQGHLQMVIHLMRYGADPTLADKEGYLGLHLAVLFQHMPIAAYLMAKGQEVDTPDINGQTSLMLAAQKIIGPEPTNFLLRCNASVNAVDKMNRNSPLHCAVLAGNVDAVHILLESGAGIDLQNADGHTPLDLAHQVNSPLLIHMLNVVKNERNKSSSPCLRVLTSYRVYVLNIFTVCVMWAVGAILDMRSDSWLLKGVLLASIMAFINFSSRKMASAAVQALIPATLLTASVLWMVVTWFLWFLPEGISPMGQVMFIVNVSALLYYYLRTLRTDPGVIRLTEEEKKKNIVVLAEAGCLDPRIFCTSCMMRKPMRAQHCFYCNSCIAKQDHHSLWINGCIGARNHHYFVLFLITFNQHCVWMIYGSFVYWSQHCVGGVAGGVWDAVTGLLTCSPWVTYICIISLLHLGWTSVTLIQQLVQVAFFGLTTAERMSLMRGHGKLPQPVSLRQNPFNRGVFKNLVNFFQLRCCGLCKPLVLDWTQEFHMGLNQDHGMFHGSNSV